MRGLIVAIVLVASAVHADDKPWAQNVSAENQKKALALYNAANELFDADQYDKALELYTEALALWDHPKIHYNAGICLKKLDRPIEAHDQLVAALKYGEAPFSHDVYEQAVVLERELGSKLAALEISCQVPGAKVSLDGKLLFEAPGATTTQVIAGRPHQLVAEKPHYQTETRAIELEPGKKTTLVIDMHLLPTSNKRLVRRWAKWKPWAVLAGGGAVAIAGGALTLKGYYDIKAYDDQVAKLWNANMSAPPMPAKSYIDQKNSGVTLGHIGVPAAIAGGAIAATGFVMILMNQPHLVTIAPALGKEQTGVSISGRF